MALELALRYSGWVIPLVLQPPSTGLAWVGKEKEVKKKRAKSEDNKVVVLLRKQLFAGGLDVQLQGSGAVHALEDP